jgi:hypothetical protein
MLKLPRAAVCLAPLLALLVGGCGSTKTTSTTTTTASTPTTGSTNTGTTPPAVKVAKTATQSTGAKQPTHTTVAPPQPQRREKPADAKRKRKEFVETESEAKEAGRASSEKAPPHQYPRFFQIKFIVSCEAAGGSNSSCECILTKLEKLPGEKDKSLAELLALELEFKNGVPLRRVAGLPRLVQRITNQCRSK